MTREVSGICEKRKAFLPINDMCQDDVALCRMQWIRVDLVIVDNVDPLEIF